jgi:acyl-CoA synthetase (AMP-forming)/AMP-acid ligase II
VSWELRLQPDPARLTLGRFLDDVAERHGPSLALREPGRDITTQQLRTEARELARALVGAGVGKGTRVGLYFGNGIDFAAALFAVGLVGGVAVPVNTFAVESERDHILRHGDVALLLMHRRFGNRDFAAELFASHPEVEGGMGGRLHLPALPHLRRVVVYGDAAEDEFRSLGDDVPDALLDALSSEVEPSDDALLVYTSGTTALPKGVVHLHRAPVIQSWRFAEYLELDEDDRIFTVFPFFWTAGIYMSLGASLAAGATLLLDPVFDAARALETIAHEHATVLHAWPHQEKALAEHPSAATLDLASLRKLEFDSPLAPIVGLEKDVWSMHSSYGLSETFTLSSALPAGTPVGERRGVHGKPLPGMTLRIVDPETGEPVGRGESGEIAVKGVTFMRGYHKVDPENVVDENGFFRTRDGGSLDAEGRLHWTGRLSNLIKTGGANVSPLEIEARALEFPGLHVAAALGIPHPTLGEAIVLAAVPSEGREVDPEALRAFLKERLSAYKMPRHVVTLEESEVTYTGTNKLQVAPLVEAVAARLGAAGTVIAGHRYGSGGAA